MDKKYTIFVSSTQRDLRDEREAVAKAILELGHIPVGMEMFSAADEQQWQLIQRQIDQSDYYIVIIAHRYGSLAGDVSYTEREYDYAVERGVPVLGFIIEDNANWPVDRVEPDNAKRKRLLAFKQKVKNKMVSFWNNADQLNAKVLAALSKQFALTPRPGWVRAIDVPGPEVLAELSRLSKENSELRFRVAAEPVPEFEIMYADLHRIRSPSEYDAQMIVLVHYHGPPLYLPSHRCRMTLDSNASPRLLKTYLAASSTLIHREGDDLQIEGSGYVHFVSTDAINPGELGGAIKLKLTIRLRSASSIVLSAELRPPDWRYGEAGLDLAAV
jgi:uncharacterized protein DUF4062